jgi:hypothetical protein
MKRDLEQQILEKRLKTEGEQKKINIDVRPQSVTVETQN